MNYVSLLLLGFVVLYPAQATLFKLTAARTTSEYTISGVNFKPCKTEHEPIFALHRTLSNGKIPKMLAFSPLSLPQKTADLQHCREKELLYYAFNNDGTLLAVIFKGGDLNIWQTCGTNCAQWSQLFHATIGADVRGVCFHPTRNTIAIAYSTNIVLYEPSEMLENRNYSLTFIQNIPLPQIFNESVTIAFNSDASFLACAFLLINMETGEVIDPTADDLLQDDVSKTCVRWQPGSCNIAFKNNDDHGDVIFIFKPEEKDESIPWPTRIRDIQWSPDGRYLVVLGYNGTISLYSPTLSKVIATLFAGVTWHYISCDSAGARLGVADDKTAAIYDIVNYVPALPSVQMLSLFSPGKSFSYLMAIIYAMTALYEEQQQKIDLLYLAKLYKNHKSSIVKPTLLALRAFWENLKIQHKIDALIMLDLIANKRFATTPSTSSFLKLFFEHLLDSDTTYGIFKRFRMSLIHDLFCHGCNKVKKTGSNTAVITLVSTEESTLETLLENYFAMQERNVLCESCNKTVRHTSKKCIAQAPEIVIIDLKPYYSDADKTAHACPLVLDNLNLAQFGTYPTNGENYYLKAFIACSNDVKHAEKYKTYVRNGSMWLSYYKKLCKVRQEKIDSLTTKNPLTKRYIPNILFYCLQPEPPVSTSLTAEE